MKRVFTLITLLITLSLIGIISIQVSWLDSMLTIKREQLHEMQNKAMFEVVNDLNEELSSFALQSPSEALRSLVTGEPGSPLAPPLVSQRYSVFDIQRKLRKSFEEHGQGGTQFEFAVLLENAGPTYEMMTPGFEAQYMKAAGGSQSHWVSIWPVLPNAGSETESLKPPEKLMVVIPDDQGQALRSLRWLIFVAVLFTLMIIAAFYVTVRTLLRQKKLSEIKSDFINNMTHELKTPLATISIAVDSLRNEKVMGDPERMEFFSGVIKEENKRMNQQVETILQAALFDKDAVTLDRKPVVVHDAIARICDNLRLQLEKIEGSVVLELRAVRDTIKADELHFSNMLSNLMDNAVKYRRQEVPPEIRISTEDNGRYLRIRVEDNGIGMNKETVSHIFEKFYRAHTGNIHNVKGFGLGLSYVKSIVDAHSARIHVDSTPGKGSRFTLDFPLEA